MKTKVKKKLIVSLSKLTLSDDFVVVYPANRTAFDFLKLFLRVNKLMMKLVNRLAWSENGGSDTDVYKAAQDKIKQKIDEIFVIVKTLENSEKQRRSK